MANSRLEKIGTIYSRTRGLIQSGALNWEDRPLWYDIYEAFPPKEEPRYDRPKPNIQLKKIFYHEDKIRALFHNNNKNTGTINMFNHKTKTLTQKFVGVYKEIEKKYDENTPELKIYEEALEFIKRERANKKENVLDEEEIISLAKAFQEAQNKNASDKQTNININVKDIFKE